MNSDGSPCNCDEGPRHFIVKRITNGDAEMAGDRNCRYTRAEAVRKAKEFAERSKGGDTYGVFQLVDAYKPVSRVRPVDVAEVA